MNTVEAKNGTKWIQTTLALFCVLCSYLIFKLLQQFSEWFDLEAKVSNFNLLAQGLSVVFAASLFVILYRRKEVFGYLNEVYLELTKVIWPDKESVGKLTIGIVISTVILSLILVSVDLIVKKILSLVY